MTDELTAPWLFIIDTEDYAGNFERDLCAYITGRVGECGVGDEEAALFTEETGQEGFENVVEESDDHGCHRPASIYPTPGWYNNGYGFGYKDGEEAEALVAYRKQKAAHHREDACVKYYEEWLKDPTCHDRYIKAGYTEAKLKKYAKNCEKLALEAEKATEVAKYPCYNSVAISFDKKPTKKQIALMKERAFKFAALKNKYDPKRTLINKIIGFRLIENVIERKPKERAI